MDRRRQQAIDSKQLILTALIAALIGIGAQQNIAEGYVKQYIEHNGMPSQVELESYLEEMVNQYLDSPSLQDRTQESKPPDIRVFDCGDQGTLQAVIKDTPSDGNCFMWSVIDFRKDCLSKGIECPNFPLDPSVLRRLVVDFMRSNLDHPTMYSGISLREYFNRNYGPSVPRSSRIKVRRSGEPSPERACFYVNDVMSYLDEMSQPRTHVDEPFIAAFAMRFQLRVQVITQALSEARPVQSMDDPNLEVLIAFGVSLNDAKQLLIKFQGNVNQAIDEVSQQREPEPVVDLSTILWQIQPYGKSTDTRIGIVCSSGHYELMLPPPISHHPEQQIRLPRRKPSAGEGGSAAFSAQPAPSSRKFLASGGRGAAAVPHQQHQQRCSFGHSQPPYPPRKPAYPPSKIVVFDGSNISGLNSEFAFYYAIIHLVKKSGLCTSSFKVTNLTLVKGDLETACEDGVNVFGSFITSEDGSPEDRFRAVGFKLENGTVVNHTGTAASLSDPTTKDDFVRSVEEKWQFSMITDITFAMCI
jgi:hypothetical protein